MLKFVHKTGRKKKIIWQRWWRNFNINKLKEVGFGKISKRTNENRVILEIKRRVDFMVDRMVEQYTMYSYKEEGT